MTFATFTRPDGLSVIINSDFVEEIAPAGELHRAASTIVYLTTGFQFVTEPLEDVAQKLGIEVKA